MTKAWVRDASSACGGQAAKRCDAPSQPALVAHGLRATVARVQAEEDDGTGGAGEAAAAAKGARGASARATSPTSSTATLQAVLQGKHSVEPSDVASDGGSGGDGSGGSGGGRGSGAGAASGDAAAASSTTTASRRSHHAMACRSLLSDSAPGRRFSARFNVQGKQDLLDRTGPLLVFVGGTQRGELTAGAKRSLGWERSDRWPGREGVRVRRERSREREKESQRRERARETPRSCSLRCVDRRPLLLVTMLGGDGCWRWWRLQCRGGGWCLDGLSLVSACGRAAGGG
jgi:hypothetical protein